MIKKIIDARGSVSRSKIKFAQRVTTPSWLNFYQAELSQCVEAGKNHFLIHKLEEVLMILANGVSGSGQQRNHAHA
jgi:hypothetical protein